LRLLIKYGTTPKALNNRPENSWEIPGASNGSVFDNFALRLSLPDMHISNAAKNRNCTLFKLLEGAGDNFLESQKGIESKHSDYWCEHFKVEVEQLHSFPE
jgi:hypothetical protein